MVIWMLFLIQYHHSQDKYEEGSNLVIGVQHKKIMDFI